MKVAPRSGTSRDGRSGPPPQRGRLRRLPVWIRWGGPALLVLVIAALAARALAPPPAAPATAVATPTGSRLIAHGTIAPVSQARVGTLTGGVLADVGVSVGQQVAAQQDVARVRGPSATEQLVAPFNGTVTGLLAHTGDTLVPGAGVLLVADLSRLQVETTDVDEFLIGHVRPGQSVGLSIDALDRRELTGRVLTVSLQPQTNSTGDQHYPVTIDLGGSTPDLRPGMSIRITFSP